MEWKLKVLCIVLCGRGKGAAMVDRLGKNSELAEVDINNMDSLETALKGARKLHCMYVLLVSTFY